MDSLFLGGRIIELQAGNSPGIFSIHEDLLCATSERFKKQFQRNHKLIRDDCLIWSRKLVPQVEPLEYYRAGCGANMHEKCFEKWMEQHNLSCLDCQTISATNQDNAPHSSIAMLYHPNPDALRMYLA
ncbi:hypothetical protein K458DRAFT_387659 [Lentithecium fluviatile CBS 122367]|uniref:Uncharacterized protein n=1 Tax=Lentithecium fluviatile CBS 122367 TaxID=1168545 RepID=A0A6G1J5K5_9PLEO|nr:hypothetical protein K458DRAFT_387659 [Lentithecium fluviatile CBS 122367]